MRKLIFAFLSIVIIIVMMAISVGAVANKPVYNSNLNESKKIALTFDDGPHPRNTPEILKILDKYGVKATFFVIGVNAKNYPEALSKIVESGHEIGNHTYSHKILKSRSKEEINKEIIDTEMEISKKSEYVTTLIRPPCGFYDQELISLANENGYKVVLWSIDTHDWAHASVESIVSTVTNGVQGGDIILFHDYISGENNTPEALQIIIPRLLKQGYEFVTVSELLQSA